MADALIGATVKITLEKVMSFATRQIRMIRGFQENLEGLRKTVNMILAVVDDAEEKQVKETAVNLWLKELEELAYRAELVLDEVNYEMLRRRVEDQNRLKCKVRFSLSHNTTVFRFRMARKLRNINTKFESSNRKAIELGLQSRVAAHVANINRFPTTMGSSRETDSIVGQKVIGRENDESKIVEKLLSRSDELLSIIPITGMGGLGKTTLAKNVYNNKQIVKHFGKRIWVHVSENFEPIRIFKMMLESLTMTGVTVEGRDTLVQKIKEELRDKRKEELGDKRYLLVLDDVWNKEPLEDILTSLNGISSTPGNWIIVTTRQQQVASISSERHRIPLGKLTDEECLCIVKEKARLPAGVVPEFETISLKITGLCQGLPLAASVIGGLLYTKPREEWLSVLQKGISNMSGDEYSNVMQILKLSFDHLPSPSVKKCFAYCSLFKKGSLMKKDELTELWMAAGFLQPNIDDMERGNQCINDLLDSSLLQEIIDKDGHSTLGMHDLVHDLARGLAQSKNDLKDVNCQDRYLVVDSLGEETKTVPKKRMRMLHTLFFGGDIPDDMLVNFKHLSVLKLSWVEELPISIGKLIHLSYFELSHSTIKALPKGLCKLYNLQTLRISGCNELRTLPKDMTKLVSLRHLHCDMDLEMPPNIGRLTCLQTLEFFNVRQEKGHQIKELGCLENIRGKLSISNIERVNGKEEAMQAGLYRKEIKILEFNWSGVGENDEGVLEGLQPPPNLQQLSIKSFFGSQFPSWSTTLDGLTSLFIIDCKRCKQLPALGNLPLLKYLKLKGLDYISCIDPSFYGTDDHSGSRINKDIFPALRHLQVLSMRNLKVWTEPEIANGEVVHVFPNLEYLTIQNCNQLTSLPCELLRSCASLQTLKISFCNGLTSLPCQLLRSCVSLQTLEISFCKGLTSLPFELLHSCASLQTLEILKWNGLTSLPCELLRSCASLQTLLIFYCNGLTSLPCELLRSCASLQTLQILECNGLTSLPCELLRSCASLQTLQIFSCDGLTSLPCELLRSCASLQTLQILKCNGLTSLPCELLRSCASLQTLQIGECNGLTSLPCELLRSCASLQSLRISCCNGLTSLPCELLRSCASLQTLEISGCNGLTSLPCELLRSCASLQTLLIFICNGLTSLPCELLRSCASLQTLAIYNCNGLTSLPTGLLKSCDLHQMPYLSSLTIGGFSDSMRFNWSAFSSLYLRELELCSWPHLLSLPDQLQHLTALKVLRLRKLGQIEALPDWFANLVSLEGLWLSYCEKLCYLPSVAAMRSLTKLSMLDINNCPLLKERCTQRTGPNSEYAKISHISQIYIDHNEIKYEDLSDEDSHSDSKGGGHSVCNHIWRFCQTSSCSSP